MSEISHLDGHGIRILRFESCHGSMTLTYSLKEYLEPIMPSKSFNSKIFDGGNNVLSELDKSSVKNGEIMSVVPQWQTLIPPEIQDEAESEICEALLRGYKIEVLI